MARPGTVRCPKVLSSGRLTGAAKLPSGKKQIGLRRACHSDVDSGYSLYSTDSEDQVATIHNGLDRCAALLKDILQNEATGMETVHRKSGKVTSVKANTRPGLAKGNSSKKKGLKRNVLPAHIHKEIVPVTNRKPASCNILAVDKDGELSSTVQNPPGKSVHVPFNQHSPVMHQKLCEHVQTQMSLITGEVAPSCNGIPTASACPVSDPEYQNATAFNYRLSTSTPTLSPQQPANPLFFQSGVPVQSYNQCAPQVGGAVFFPVVSAGTCISSQAQSVTTGSHMTPCVPLAVPNNSTVSATLQAAHGRETISNQENNEQRVKEADLIRCIQAHLAILESHEAQGERAGEKYQKFDPAQYKVLDTKEETAEEHNEGTTSSEEEDWNAVDVAPVRETSCQTSFDKKILKPKKAIPEKTAQKVKTLKYLLGELKALSDQDDSEILRLIREIEDCVSLLPAVVGSTNVQAEIALAVQPLRSENAHLRRRLRILNQQLRERERAEKETSLDCNFELVSLQSLNITLQSQLKESLKGLESLHSKNEELLKIIENQKEENKQFIKLVQEKEGELLENKQHYDIEITKLKIEADEALANVKNFQFKLEASEKENQILGITLRQRDAEVNRLRELTRTLQNSMAKLLSDLTIDNIRHRPEKCLTKSLLEDHEKQLNPNPFPVSTSIMSYLKNLESDQILTHTELQFSNKAGELEMPCPPCEKFVAEGTHKKSTLLEEKTAKRIFPTPSKQDTETVSDSETLIEEEHKLDETIYIPLTSSASKKQPSVSERNTCAQHQVSVASKRLDYNCGLSDSQKQNEFRMLEHGKTVDKFSSDYSLRNTVENKSETTGKKTELAEERLLVKPKVNDTTEDFIDKSETPQPDTYLYTYMPHQNKNIQKRSAEISNSSFCTFDRMSGKSEWSISSFSTFTSQDEEDFKNGLAALDANIARLQRTLQTGIMKP